MPENPSTGNAPAKPAATTGDKPAKPAETTDAAKPAVPETTTPAPPQAVASNTAVRDEEARQGVQPPSAAAPVHHPAESTAPPAESSEEVEKGDAFEKKIADAGGEKLDGRPKSIGDTPLDHVLVMVQVKKDDETKVKTRTVVEIRNKNDFMSFGDPDGAKWYYVPLMTVSAVRAG